MRVTETRDTLLPSTLSPAHSTPVASWEGKTIDQPAQRGGLPDELDRANASEQSSTVQLSDRAPYPTRLRAVLGLSLLLWATIALVLAWALRLF